MEVQLSLDGKKIKKRERVSLMDRCIPAKEEDEYFVGNIICPECGEKLDLICIHNRNKRARKKRKHVLRSSSN